MMKKIIIILLTFALLSCNNYDYKVSSLKHGKIGFNELPSVVQSYFNNPDSFSMDNNSINEMINLEGNDRFSVETINTWYGPWIAYEKLKDKQKNLSYRIETHTPWPYVIYENKLFVPTCYNIFTSGRKLRTIEFNWYHLK